MLRAFLSFIVLAGLALAQQANDPSPQAANAHGSNAGQLTIQGCVQGDQRYSLTQASTGTVFSLEGDAAKLAAAKGKVAEVTGREMPPDASEAGSLPRLQVDEVRVVAEQCPSPGHAGAANSASHSTAPSSPKTTSPYSPAGAPDQTPPSVNNPNVSGASGTPSPGTGNPPPPRP